MAHAEHMELRKLRSDPMVATWISAYQTDKWSTHKDCWRCGFPHSDAIMCGMGAAFGRLRLGKDTYSIDLSNVVWFHKFMTETLGVGWGFHWRNEMYFKRANDGVVEVRYIEQYNNSPQIRLVRIPPTEWASIVCSVSKEGETGDRWNAALGFHGRSSRS